MLATTDKNVILRILYLHQAGWMLLATSLNVDYRGTARRLPGKMLSYTRYC
jgi:hypothetical protein